MRPYPEQSVFDWGHPLAGTAPWNPASDARDTLRLWCDFRPAINSVVVNQPSGPAGLTWGTISTPRPMVGTIDGRSGLSLAATAQVTFPPECGVPANTDRLTAWCRFVPNASPANGTYVGVLGQWNNGGVTTAYQSFSFFLSNNAVGTPARTLEFLCLMDDFTFRGAEVQYAATDVGDVWTAVGVADGSAVRLYLFKSSGLLVGTTTSFAGGSTYSAPRVIHGSSVGNVAVGYMDGGFADMTVLGCGVWSGRALTEAQIHELHDDPWGIVAPKQQVVVSTVVLLSPPPVTEQPPWLGQGLFSSRGLLVGFPSLSKMFCEPGAVSGIATPVTDSPPWLGRSLFGPFALGGGFPSLSRTFVTPVGGGVTPPVFEPPPAAFRPLFDQFNFLKGLWPRVSIAPDASVPNPPPPAPPPGPPDFGTPGRRAVRVPRVSYGAGGVNLNLLRGHTEVVELVLNALLRKGRISQIDKADDFEIVAGGFRADRAPDANDDEDNGAFVGVTWFNRTDQSFWVCVDATAGAAVWRQVTLT